MKINNFKDYKFKKINESKSEIKKIFDLAFIDFIDNGSESKIYTKSEMKSEYYDYVIVYLT